MTLRLAAVPTAITAVHTTLPDWTTTNPDAYQARDHRKYEWHQPGQVVCLSIWDSASTASVTISYRLGGAEVAHLVLSSIEQVRPWLRLVGAVEPTRAELAAALVVA
jgi:hypothetical protein